MATLVRKEIQEFQFKLLTQLKLFPSQQSIKLDSPKNLIATASKYGLIFVGHSSGITCIKTSDIVAIQNQRNNNRGYVTSFPRRELKLNVLPSHVAVSCDNELLAVAVVIDNCPILLIYGVTSFGSAKLNAKCNVRMSSTPGVLVKDLQWNPGVANMIGAVLSDGSAVVCEFKDSSPVISSVPPNSQATCLCWSPKGKQIAIGAKNGSLTQFKPDLKAVKTFPPPQIFNQPEVVSVHWLSNYQFIAAYKDRVDNSSKPAVVLVNVPKGANATPSFLNFEDICFGFGTDRPEHYFFHQQRWNVIILGNSNSSEVVVLGQNGDSWEQWLQDESNRALLPVSEDYQDVYLVGMAIDYSPQAPVPIGENNFINPMPFLLMYSQEGVLCFYHIINLIPNSVSLCQAPAPLPDQSGIHLFVDTTSADKQEVVNNDAGNQVSEGQSTNQGFQFKSPSFGTEPSLLQPTSKEPTPPMSAASPFSVLGLLKSNQPLTMNASQGNIPSTGGGLVGNLGATTTGPTFAPPKSTSTPFSAQPTTLGTHSSPFFFQPSLQSSQPPPPAAPAPQLLSSQSDSIQQPTIANQSNFGFNNAFQTSTSLPLSQITSSSSSVPPFSTGTSSIQGFNAKPALLTAPPNTNTSSIIPQGMSVPSSKSSSDKPPLLTNEMINKVPTTTKPPDVKIVGSKEPAEVTQTISAAPKSDVKNEVVEVDFIGALKEEVSNFKTEMNSLDQLKSSLNFSVGHEEVNNIASKINDLKIFEKDVQETTQAQESEVSALVSSLVEMFSWLENVKTKQKQMNNPRYMDLIETQDLDPVTKKHLNNIEQYIYYLETQIKQAHLQLDSLWSQHKGSVKPLELPNMESIYLTILSENYILAAQKVRITELEVRLKEKLKTFSKKIPNLTEFSFPSVKSSADVELDVLADKLLLSKLNSDENNLDTFKNNSENGIIMSTSQRYLSPKKETLLHKWHKNHVVINAKAPKRQSGRIDLTKYSKLIPKVEPSAQNVSTTSAKSIFTIPTDQSNYMSKISPVSDESNAGGEPVGGGSFNAWDDKSISGKVLSNSIQEQALTKNTVAETNLTSKMSSFNIGTSSAQPAIKVDNNFAYKSPQSTTVVTSRENAVESNLIANNERKDALESTPDSRKDASPLNNKVGTTLTFGSSLSLGGTNVSTTPSSTPSFDKQIATSTVGNMFGTLPSNQTTFSSFSFNKPPLFSNVSTTSAPSTVGLKTTSSFGAPLVSGNATTTAPTSIFGVKPLTTTSSSFISPTSTSLITTSTSLPTTTMVTKQSPATTVSAVSTSPATTTTTSFFTKPSAMKSLFGSAPISAANVTTCTSLFKTTTSLSASIFASGQPQQLFSTASTAKPESLAGSAVTSSAPVSALTPTTTVGSTSAPNSVSTSSPSTLNNATVTAEPVLSSAANVTVTTVSNLAVSSAPSVAVSSSASKVSTAVTEKEITSTTSPFGTTTGASSIFGAKTSLQSTSGLFDSAVSTPNSLSKTFGTTTTTVTATSAETSIFASAVSKPSIFGNQGTPPSFGSNLTAATSSSALPVATTSVFGSPTSKTTTSSIFGASPTFATSITGSSVFGTTTPTTSASVFGATTSTTSAPVFGVAAATTSASVFGAATSTTTASVFGASTLTTSASVFGAPTSTTSSSVFGATTSTTSPSIFGTTTPTTSASVFGATTSTTSSSVFGAASALASTSFFASPTTSAPAFGASPPAPSLFSPPAATTTTTSFFGQAVCSPTSTVANAFSNISFGQKPATVTTTAASIFGGNRTSFETKPLFGGVQSGNLFGQTATTSSPGTFGMSGGSLFGNTSTFSFDSPQQQQQSTNLFQSPSGTPGNLFSSGSPGGGSFSSGNQSVAQSGFGAPPNFQSAPKPFGAPGSPVFGGQTSFGAPPTFGGSATFGSPNKVFGSPTPGTGAFGSPTQQSSTFENLAGQNTLTFGNLAQGQTGFNTNPTFGVNTQQQPSFPNTSTFGGSSFSTWR